MGTKKTANNVLLKNLRLTELCRLGQSIPAMQRETLEDFAKEAVTRLEMTYNTLQLAYEMIDSLEAEDKERSKKPC